MSATTLRIHTQEVWISLKLLQRSLLVVKRFASAKQKLAVFCARDRTKGHQTRIDDISVWQE